jgi:hypothetical protein
MADNDDSKNRLERMFSESQHNGKSSLAVVELGQIDPRELSPDVPILWRDFAKDQQPYVTIEEEYIRSPRPVPVAVLRRRWQGLYSNEHLEQFSETPKLRAQRFKYQDEISKQTFTTCMAADVEFQKRRIDQEIIDICHLISVINDQIERGYEYVMTKNAGPLGYSKVPLTTVGLDKLIKMRLAASDALATRLGLANDVLKITVEVTESIEERMSRVLGQSDPEYAQIMQTLNGKLGRPNAARPAFAPIVGDVAESHNGFEQHKRRVIEHIPPRIVDALPPEENTGDIK